MNQTRMDIVVLDASVLINFLTVDRMDLINGHPSRFLITAHVQEEVQDFYEEQYERLQIAIASQVVEIIDVHLVAHEMAIFQTLIQGKQLGSGECSAIAAAINRKYRLAIDDKRAIKKALDYDSSLPIIRTHELMVEMIHGQQIDVGQADQIKETWEEECRFKLKFDSFSELF